MKNIEGLVFVARFTMVSNKVNRRGGRYDIDGIKIDNFKNNPIALIMHNNSTFAIGRWENVKKHETGNGIKELQGDLWLDSDDDLARAALGKIRKRLLNTVSITTTVEGYREPDKDEQKNGQIWGTITKSELLECSLVNIPNYGDATAKHEFQSDGFSIEFPEVSELSEKNENSTSPQLTNSEIKSYHLNSFNENTFLTEKNTSYMDALLRLFQNKNITNKDVEDAVKNSSESQPSETDTKINDFIKTIETNTAKQIKDLNDVMNTTIDLGSKIAALETKLQEANSAKDTLLSRVESLEGIIAKEKNPSDKLNVDSKNSFKDLSGDDSKYEEPTFYINK